jgi:hypothetical protein
VSNASISTRHHLAHRTQHAGRIRHDVVCLGEIHGAAVERAYLGPTLSNVLHTLFGAGHVRAILVEWQWRIRRAKNQVAAHARRQVDYHIGIGITDAFRDFAVQLDAARVLSGLGIPHMAMHNGRPGLCGIDRAVSNFFRCTWHLRGTVLRIAGPRYRAGDEYFSVHCQGHCMFSRWSFGNQLFESMPGMAQFNSRVVSSLCQSRQGDKQAPVAATQCLACWSCCPPRQARSYCPHWC